MDIIFLSDDEIGVEAEIRNLSGDPKQILCQLKAQISLENKNPLLQPITT